MTSPVALLIAIFCFAGSGLLIAHVIAAHIKTNDLRRLKSLLEEQAEKPSQHATGIMGRLPPFLERKLVRAGWEPSRRQIMAGAAAASLAVLTATLLVGPLAGALTAITLALLVLGALEYRANVRMRLLSECMLGLLERMRQLLSVGNSLSVALERIVENSPPIVTQCLTPTVRRIANGSGVAESLERAAAEMDLYELHLLATATRTNLRFGGSMTTILRNIIENIRRRASIERELRANTTQVRASAWVLALLPVLVATLVILTNRDYSRWFLATDKGHYMLAYAVCSQIAGAVCMRMIIRDAVLIMSAILTWLLFAACSLTGGLALARGVRNYATGQTVVRRFRQHISPNLAPIWPMFHGRALLESFGRKVAGTDSVRGLQELLLQAGFLSPSAVFLFAGLRLIATLTVAGFSLFPSWLRDGGVSSGEAATAFFLGFFVYRSFSIFLKLRSETRQREIRRELPYILDLLLMVLDSGVSIDQALQHVSLQVGRIAPLSGQMLARYIADTEDGMPYDKALDRLAQRLAISEGRDFANLLKQNLFQGGELSQPLRRLAGDISETRLSQARERLGRKSVLLTLVMLAFFMPVLLIAIAAPAISDVMGTMHHVAQDMNASRGRK